MTKQKMIPCRVCGKLFKPCGYCQSHSDIFRWRNFACSRECAQKYLSDTIAYREEQHKNENDVSIPLSGNEEIKIEKEKLRKTRKKSPEATSADNAVADMAENKKDNETE